MISSVEYIGQRIEFEVEFRNRRTLAIYVRPPGNIKVYSPVDIPEREIRDWVRSKGKWIVEKLEKVRYLDPEKLKKRFVDGESFLFLGKNYDLKIIINRRKIPKVFFNNNIFNLEISIFEKEKLRKAMEKWYRKKAEIIINDRVEIYSGKIGRRACSVMVKQQKRRWGSCNTKGNLYFNWRLAMAPPEIIDYVVVHEMSHLVHADHSKSFWDKVGYILPDYKNRRKWLKENGVKLDI